MSPTRRRAIPRRGRPHKYGRPARVVALTLPQQTIDALSAVHADLGWAVVTLVEKDRRGRRTESRAGAAQLVEIGGGQALIVVDPILVRALPEVHVVPLSTHQAFLALAPGRGMADLELAVSDRLETLRPGSRLRTALEGLRGQLRRWRRDSTLAFEPRAIILASRRRK